MNIKKGGGKGGRKKLAIEMLVKNQDIQKIYHQYHL